ncbi:MAG: D-2-hydroxyacid dehydrogenase [Gammaproteobacteria bacterium]|nr:D-2-hydroxyacid dehydrogenase [Gammaproteobacteria bacterium]
MKNTDVLRQGIFLDVNSMGSDDLDFSLLNQQLKRLDLRSLSAADEIKEDLTAYDVIITNKVNLSRQCLENNRHIKLICVAATGTNNIDLQAAADLGIKTCNVTGYAGPSVVQHVFSLILALQTRLLELTDAVRRGEWSRSPYFSLLDYPVHELAGKTLGIVGYGDLGRAVSRVAEALGMKILIAKRNYQDDRAGRVSLNEMLPLVDVLSLHCPLTKETENLIDVEEFELMKSSAIIINTARGGIINEKALLNALQRHQIAAAGIDVLTVEPPPEDHPLLSIKSNNLIITPHVAWASQESRQRLLNEIALNIKAFNAGDPRNLV